MQRMTREIIQPIVDEIKSKMRCNCDLDNWEPERSTGHSRVCRIHRAAIARFIKLYTQQPARPDGENPERGRNESI